MNLRVSNRCCNSRSWTNDMSPSELGVIGTSFSSVFSEASSSSYSWSENSWMYSFLFHNFSNAFVDVENIRSLQMRFANNYFINHSVAWRNFSGE